MHKNNRNMRGWLGLAVLGGVLGSGAVQAGGFAVPTFGTPGWGRAFAGGSLFAEDPSAAFNNPAAMGFIQNPVAQMSVHYADVDIKFRGHAYDYQGEPMTHKQYDDEGNLVSSPMGEGGNGGFTAWLPTAFLVVPINDQLSFGLSQVVPLGMRSTWDQDWVGRDFAVDTKIETAGLAGSLSFKVNDELALGAGVIVQRTQGFVSQNIDLYAAASQSPNLGDLQFPAGFGSNLIRVKVDNVSPGWFVGAAWKPTASDTFGLNYHARIRNKLTGKYNMYADDASQAILDSGLVESAYPGLILKSGGASASAQMDVPASAALDWVHRFDDRFSLGTSLAWTQWSSFEDLTLKSHGNTIVSIPYNYRDTWMVSLGGDYRVTDQWTLRAGVAYDQTPTRDSTRDPRIPDGNRRFLSLGASYRFQSLPSLSLDAAYSRQFVQDARLKTENQDRLGSGRLDGKAESKGQVMSVSATYQF
ncbi:outer membrane protein transport protein [Pseudomonas mangiferae]|uniref:Outer membrane protein transport protein n=1 Tax=Pseudomonas mangiferae TaxID=2593654 RepID=A0A553H486_9PSED|nr:outer membrane protein transport protein [Pseudomonas mangiferae]TRX76565.1 outer membrane protein transport protein [Pseudomonas mangiferae]